MGRRYIHNKFAGNKVKFNISIFFYLYSGQPSGGITFATVRGPGPHHHIPKMNRTFNRVEQPSKSQDLTTDSFSDSSSSSSFSPYFPHAARRYKKPQNRARGDDFLNKTQDNKRRPECEP